MSDQTPPQYPDYPSYPAGGEQPPAYGTPPPAYGAVPIGSPYASWWSRVGAYLLDGLFVVVIVLVPVVVGAVIAFANADIDPASDEITGNVQPLGVVIMVLGVIGGIAFDIWNRGVRLGNRGQSIGKGIVGLSVVRAENGQFLGAGAGFLRWLMGFALGIVSCVQLLDLLWPLWDEKNQTLHDKIVGSVVIRT